MDYNDEIKYALKARNTRAIEANENDLLMAIQYTSGTKITKPRSKQYSISFLKALSLHGIDYWKADTTDDGKWHFNLPKTGGEIDDN